ncbi:hypothetical protein Cgig2_001988 [Carnegiea gigantea]|uniref:Histone deacetylase complex subunit SAP30 Sin3 binding domain-containing protein n=1 Tax=Carnegiea gigantea TaxID=171969 RepID=A0A9Q1K1L8_9CARY|nr:hypothetical protein Cgig2_001988 [Carnegiea gigantea]
MKMIESEVCAATRVISPFREESGDEELSVLPRHTKVVVTGNNRTKSVLVGLQGVVKKAVGLGGWHWLVLKNGIEVKLQRNALSVLEPPTGNEDDDELDHSSSSSDLIDKEPDFPSSMEFHKVSKPRVRHTRPWAQSTLAKSNNRSCFKEFHCDFHAPHCGSMNSTSSREHLVNIVQRHFASQQVDEAQVIAEFVRAAKKLRTNNGGSE